MQKLLNYQAPSQVEREPTSGNKFGNADVLLHALLGVSAVRGKTESHLINRFFCEENNI